MLGQVREKGLRDNARRSLTSLYDTLRKGEWENDGFKVPPISQPNEVLQSVMDKEVLIADLQMVCRHRRSAQSRAPMGHDVRLSPCRH